MFCRILGLFIEYLTLLGVFWRSLWTPMWCYTHGARTAENWL